MRDVCWIAATAVLVAACGGGGDNGGGTGPNPVGRVDITPSAPQSTQLCGQVDFSAQPRDAGGNALSRAVSWTTSTSSIVLSSNSGTSISATGVAIGSATVTATSENVPSPGITVTVTPGGNTPASATVAATTSNTFSPGCVVVAAGGTVTWDFASVTHNVTFGTNKPTEGDIGNRENASVTRTFAAAGHYPYDCTIHPGMRGRVIAR